jgi:hypothetical protein
MKKRKAKRKQTIENIDLEISKNTDEFEKKREEALLTFIADIIVKVTLRDLYSDKDKLDNF